jgi:hypothetical protein
MYHCVAFISSYITAPVDGQLLQSLQYPRRLLELLYCLSEDISITFYVRHVELCSDSPLIGTSFPVIFLNPVLIPSLIFSVVEAD